MPLHFAIHCGKFNVTEIIINHEVVYINSIGNLENTPLHYAVTRDNLVSLLIKNGAEVNIKDGEYGKTALR
ncbi:ankyrin repeat domain-containing protein [Wolbachia endosymbiont of Wuchereria bancrofti]|uniref:ankyrin repeat domain-containing protein n=1 Tax=Wolbachia endosymbiont of Wuchereria bancrofti TaxID=96496 RepID=UPI0034E08E63